MNRVQYTFFPESIKGLSICVILHAINYKEAKRKILKYIYLDKVHKLGELK